MKYTVKSQTISWFRDRYREGNLDLKAPYQRKPVWQARQKCALIETILMGLPIPEVFLQKETTEDGEQTWGVIDGQQRIRAILQFMGNEEEASELEYNQFALDKLEDTHSRWRNLTFDELSGEERRRIFDTDLAVRELVADREGEVEDMFKRLNKNQSPLKPQELRNATYSGPFAKMATHLADDEYWAENRIVTTPQIRRMNDVEFVSELIIGVMHGPQGGSPRAIDEYYARYEDDEDEFPSQRETEKLFQRVLTFVRNTLPDIKETRWRNKTDFYTLFVAASSLLRTSSLTDEKAFRESLDVFAREVESRLADEYAKVSKPAVTYVRAHEKRANAKYNRAERQAALLLVIRKHFQSE